MRPAVLSSLGHLQMIQNKRPWCRGAAYVTAGLSQVGTSFIESAKIVS